MALANLTAQFAMEQVIEMSQFQGMIALGIQFIHRFSGIVVPVMARAKQIVHAARLALFYVVCALVPAI